MEPVKLDAGELKAAQDGTLIWHYGPKKGQPIGVQEMARRKFLLTIADNREANQMRAVLTEIYYRLDELNFGQIKELCRPWIEGLDNPDQSRNT